MEKSRLLALIEKSRSGSCTEKEQQELFDFYEAVNIYDGVLLDKDSQEGKQFIEQNYNALLDAINRKPHKRTIWKYAAVIAFGLIAVGAALKLYLIQTHKVSTEVIAKIDAAPGHDGAVLTLADGSKVILDSAGNGTVAKQGNAQIVNEKGQLLYSTVGASAQVTYNTLSTPKARQYKLVLPDGTKVWLNAESSVRYPTAFMANERIVEVTGEAYFEVVHNAKMPFKVKAGNSTIEDIGTMFDVNAYADETVIKTTLLEGAVKMDAMLLRPGQEASVAKLTGKITVSKADTEDAIAWVNGQLSLESDDVQTLMRRIARWYNVDVRFEGALPHTALFGSVDRNVYLSGVLKALADYGINARLEGNTIVVSAK